MRRRQRSKVEATLFIAQPLLEGITGSRSPVGGTRITWSLGTIVVVPDPCSPLCDSHLPHLCSSIFRCRRTSPSNFYGMNMHRPSSVPLPIPDFFAVPGISLPSLPSLSHLVSPVGGIPRHTQQQQQHQGFLRPLPKRCAPAIPGIWGRKGGGGARRLIQITKNIMSFSSRLSLPCVHMCCEFEKCLSYYF